MFNQFTKASDWKFAGVLSAGISAVGAISAWTFSFKSASAAHECDFVLVSTGIATPGVSAEISAPDLEAEDIQWTDIVCKRPFSAAELNGAKAHVITGGPSAVFVGYSELFADAQIGTDVLFQNARNNGFSLGVSVEPGFSVGEYSGYWLSIGLVLKKLVIPTLKAGILITSVGTGLFQAGDALLAGRAEAVRNAYFGGYAQGLADLTGEKFSESSTAWIHQKLLTINPNTALQSALDIYGKKGSSGASTALDQARDAGQAQILQDVDGYIKSRGLKAYETAVQKHSDVFGRSDVVRKDRYFDLLKAQYKTSGSLFGIRFDF